MLLFNKKTLAASLLHTVRAFFFYVDFFFVSLSKGLSNFFNDNQNLMFRVRKTFFKKSLTGLKIPRQISKKFFKSLIEIAYASDHLFYFQTVSYHLAKTSMKL